MTDLIPTPNCIWRPTLYSKNATFVYSDESTKPLFDLLAAQPGEKIVDMGCGTGELTLRLQSLVGQDGLVLGLDASESMLEAAEANGIKNLFCCDIQKLVVPEKFKDLTGTFDGKSATLTGQDPSGPVKTAKTLLKPGGIRCTISQVLKRRGIASPDPWFLPRASEYAKILESEGFIVDDISLNPRLVDFPGSMVDFLRALYRISYLKHVSDHEVEEVMQEVSNFCEFDQKDSAGTWSAMYVTLRFRATSPM